MSVDRYILSLSDNSMILGHRLSELCGHGPTLETDIALTNISLDLFGQVRGFLSVLAARQGGEVTEDSLAFLRGEREHLNCILTELPNTDFAHIIVRQYFFDVFHKLQLELLIDSKDEDISAIATKSLKEAKYHERFSHSWMLRLGDGTEVSNAKMQVAVNALYPYVHELFDLTDWEKELIKTGVAVDTDQIKEEYHKKINETLMQANLTIEGLSNRYAKGKHGMHTENLGFILSEFQYMQRAYPQMQW